MSPLISTYFLQRQPDDRLVAAARAGSERAFEVLVKRHQQELLAYARRLSGPDGRAEDALQQALLQAWVALRGDAHPEQFKPWLFRIVHNVVVTGLRRRQHAVVGLDEALATADRVDSVDARLAVREALSGLAALPEPQRQAIVLTAFGGSHDEVAAELGLTGGAVRGLIYRARATLRSAAALLPAPLAAWMLNRPRRSSVGERTAELIAGSSSVGAGGLIVKAGAIAATAGALAAGTQIIPGLNGAHHRHSARSAVRVAERATGASQPGAPASSAALASRTGTRHPSERAAVTGGAVAAGQRGGGSSSAWSHRRQAVAGQPRSGEPPHLGGGRSGGSGHDGAGQRTSGGSDSSGSGGGDSVRTGSGTTGTGTSSGGHDSSGSAGGGGGGSTTVVPGGGSGDGSGSTSGSGSSTVSTDSGSSSDGGSSSLTGSSGSGGGTTTTSGGD